MNVSRRDLIQGLGASALLGLSGCGTHPKKPFSLESVSSVLVSEDGKKVVVMTSDYHYIFDLPSIALTALKADFHPFVAAAFSNFHVNSSGRVDGLVTLSVDQTHPEALTSAIASGFTRDEDGAFFKTTLHGLRFKAGNIQPMQGYRLNRTYVIVVEGGQSAQSDAGPTPIGVVGATFVLAGLVLYFYFHGWPQ